MSTPSQLRIAPRFTLDADYVGSGTFALLAKKGAGKTYTARVLAEEFWRTQVPFVAIDPMGAMWGLRSSADGKHDGLPVPIFGGRHGDVPLERGGGEVIADLVVDERLSMILDLSGLGSRAAEREFARAFLERLYRRNSELVHLLVDEADLFAPQKPQAGDQPLLGTTENIVRRGRNHGIGITLITQRPAVLNKDVLTQVDGLVAGRITGYQDREAIDDWVRGHGDQDVAREVKGTLAGLANGECWWWVPELDVLKRVQVRKAETFDSSPSRKRSDQRLQPKTIADVDMGAIAERMQATIDRAKADDPRELRRRIKELEAQLADRPEPERVEVPVLTDDAREALEQAAGVVADAQSQMVDAIADASRRLGEIVSQVGVRPPASSPRQVPAARERRAAPAPTRTPRRRESTRGASADRDAQPLGKAPRTLLATLVAHEPRRLTKAELSTLSGYKPRSSTYRNALSALRVAGYLDESQGLFAPSPAGRDYIGEDAPPPPQTTEQLLEIWYGVLGKASREMLAALVAAYPGEVTRDEIADQTGYSLTSSTFRNALSALRSNGLIENLPGGDVRAADSLFIETAAAR